MVTRRVMPDGFEQVIEGFDTFAVEIRSVRYVVPQNTLSIDLTLSLDEITREEVWKLLSVFTEYFRTEQFVEFVKDIQEDTAEPFSVRLHLFNANNENTHILETIDQEFNFRNWSADFRDNE